LAKLRVLNCKQPGCENESILPPAFVREVFDRQSKSSAEDYLSFICPRCGHCYRYNLADLRVRSFSVDPYKIRNGLCLLHVSLKCNTEECEAQARVHTVVTGTKSSIEIPYESWKLHDVTCESGHSIRTTRVLSTNLRIRPGPDADL
jgi:hypothetical protein